MSKEGAYDEFVELMQVAGGIDRKKTVKTLTKLLDMEKPFDVRKQNITNVDTKLKEFNN